MPNTTKPEIPELAETLAGVMPPLQPDDQELVLALYRPLPVILRDRPYHPRTS